MIDEELPDYVMIMIANKKTKEQMEEDLVLFLGEKTQVFSHWLHDILQKLQQVSVHGKQYACSSSLTLLWLYHIAIMIFCFCLVDFPKLRFVCFLSVCLFVLDKRFLILVTLFMITFLLFYFREIQERVSA